MALEPPLRRAVVAGPGIMGRDIAAIFLSQGVDVDLLCLPSDNTAQIKQRIAKSIAQVKQEGEHGELRQFCDMDDCDWPTVDIIIEAIPEQLELKRELFRHLERRVGPQAVIGSNSSGIPISAITEGMTLAPRSVGLHFFLPAHLVPLVEVVSGQDTDADTAERARAIMVAVGRIPVMVKRDTPGFLANRLQHALMREVFAVLDEGLASPDDIDKAVRYGFGMRYVAAGPLLQKEFAGLDTQHAAATSIYPNLATNSSPGRSLTEKLNDGNFGTKSHRGFWEWTDNQIAESMSNYERVMLETLNLLIRAGDNAYPSSRELPQNKGIETLSGSDKSL